MAGLALSYTFGEFAEKARTGAFVPLSHTPPMPPAVGKVVTQVLVSDMKKRFYTSTAPDGSPWKPLKFARPTGGDKPLLDTGGMAASITGRSDARGVVVGTNHPAAPLQHNGGTVRPKHGQFLTIPLTREAKRSGGARRMSRTGRLPIFTRFQPAGEPVAHFLLVKKTEHVARPFVGVSKEAERVVSGIILDAAALSWQMER